MLVNGIRSKTIAINIICSMIFWYSSFFSFLFFFFKWAVMRCGWMQRIEKQKYFFGTACNDFSYLETKCVGHYSSLWQHAAKWIMFSVANNRVVWYYLQFWCVLSVFGFWKLHIREIRFTVCRIVVMHWSFYMRSKIRNLLRTMPGSV